MQYDTGQDNGGGGKADGREKQNRLKESERRELAGKKARLAGLLQKQNGYPKQDAEDEADEILNALSTLPF